MNRPAGWCPVAVPGWCASPGRQKSIHSLPDHIRHAGKARRRDRRKLDEHWRFRPVEASAPARPPVRNIHAKETSAVPQPGFNLQRPGEGIGGSSTSIGDFARLRPVLPYDPCAKYPREGDFCRPAAGLGEMTAVRSGRVTAAKVLPDTCTRRGPLRRSAGIAPPAGHRCGLRAPPARSIRGAAARAGSNRIPRSRAPPGRCRP